MQYILYCTQSVTNKNTRLLKKKAIKKFIIEITYPIYILFTDIIIILQSLLKPTLRYVYRKIKIIKFLRKIKNIKVLQRLILSLIFCEEEFTSTNNFNSILVI